MRPGAQVDALREVLAEVLRLDAARRHFAGMADGTETDYAPGSANPLVGRFAPAMGVTGTAASPLDGRGLLVGLDRAGDLRAALAGHRDRVGPAWAATGAEFGGASALLVRPDGYVAWAGDLDGAGDALTTWFGPPTPPAA